MPEADAEGASPLGKDNHKEKEVTETMFSFKARIPPQTPPAGNPARRTLVEAGRIHIPKNIVSPCRVRICTSTF